MAVKHLEICDAHGLERINLVIDNSVAFEINSN